MKHAFVSDAQTLDIPVAAFSDDPDFKFDAVFSNATLHWCKRDPAGVLEGVKKYLKPGGRLVVEMGGSLNCIGKPRPTRIYTSYSILFDFAVRRQKRSTPSSRFARIHRPFFDGSLVLSIHRGLHQGMLNSHQC